MHGGICSLQLVGLKDDGREGNDDDNTKLRRMYALHNLYDLICINIY